MNEAIQIAIPCLDSPMHTQALRHTTQSPSKTEQKTPNQAEEGGSVTSTKGYDTVSRRQKHGTQAIHKREPST
jgi:hypothetical protein